MTLHISCCIDCCANCCRQRLAAHCRCNIPLLLSAAAVPANAILVISEELREYMDMPLSKRMAQCGWFAAV
jgi:hypothetical protein